MYQRVKYDFKQELIKIKEAGLFKDERVILSDQKPDIKVSYPMGSEAKEVINLCSNNYLGLANHPRLIEAAHQTLDKYGLGLASVRFICGTQDLHKQLEKKISDFSFPWSPKVSPEFASRFLRLTLKNRSIKRLLHLKR